jgi:hypothetical protein
MSIADGSSNEHQVINDFYNDKKAISTVKLIQFGEPTFKTQCYILGSVQL